MSRGSKISVSSVTINKGRPVFLNISCYSFSEAENSREGSKKQCFSCERTLRLSDNNHAFILDTPPLPHKHLSLTRICLGARKDEIREGD